MYAQALERQVEEDLSAIPHRTATAQQRVAQLKQQVEMKRADLERQYAALMQEQVLSLYLLYWGKSTNADALLQMSRHLVFVQTEHDIEADLRADIAALAEQRQGLQRQIAFKQQRVADSRQAAAEGEQQEADAVRARDSARAALSALRQEHEHTMQGIEANYRKIQHDFAQFEAARLAHTARMDTGNVELRASQRVLRERTDKAAAYFEELQSSNEDLEAELVRIMRHDPKAGAEWYAVVLEVTVRVRDAIALSAEQIHAKIITDFARLLQAETFKLQVVKRICDEAEDFTRRIAFHLLLDEELSLLALLVQKYRY